MCEKELKRRSCTECPQYDGASCEATGVWLGDKNRVLQDERRHGFICHDTGETEAMLDNIASRLVDDTMYHPNSATADCIADMLHKGEGGPFDSIFTAPSPSSECPSRREGPPQKGKIAENKGSHNALRLSCITHPEARCDNCKKSQKEDGKLHCYQWGIQIQIQMPHRPCEKCAFDPLKVRAEEQQIHYAEGSGLQYVENPPPLFTRDPNGFWEPVRPRSCTNCKLYNDPICMKTVTHIGTRQEILAKEEKNGFVCFAADQMRRDE